MALLIRDVASRLIAARRRRSVVGDPTVREKKVHLHSAGAEEVFFFTPQKVAGLNEFVALVLNISVSCLRS